MTDRVRIAVQKNGRLSDESTKLLKKCGISFNKSSDKLFLRSSNMMVDILMVSCLLYTSPSPRDFEASRMPSSA